MRAHALCEGNAGACRYGDRMRTALVTGAGTGIGAATAAALATTCDRLILVGRRRDKLDAVAAQLVQDHDDVTADVRTCDLTDPAAVQALADALSADGTALDVLVANAGSVQPPLGDTLETLADAWMTTYRGNTLSAVLTVEALLPLVTRPGGRIVIVGSAGVRRGTGSPAYLAAKAALEGWIVTLMRRVAPDGITANVVAPGYTDDTELVAGRITPERRARLLTGIAVGRPAQPSEIAHAIASLAAPEAGFVTGQVVTVDGGTVIPG